MYVYVRKIIEAVVNGLEIGTLFKEFVKGDVNDIRKNGLKVGRIGCSKVLRWVLELNYLLRLMNEIALGIFLESQRIISFVLWEVMVFHLSES